MTAFIDLTHQRFGKLFVLAKTDMLASNGYALWACHCDCGNFCLAKSSALRKNNKRDCGCDHIETCRKSKVKHGYKGTKVYGVADAAIRRCHDKNKDNYKHYGARGIYVCDEWKNHRDVVCKWLEDQGFREGLQLDRVDNDKGYDESNCRLIPTSFNGVNKRGSGNSKVCGVRFRADYSNHNYLAHVTVYGKYYEIKYCKTLLDAASVRISVTNKICNRVALLCKEQRDTPIKDLEPQFIKIVEEEIAKYK